MTELNTLHAMSEALRSGEVSSLELTQDCLQRIAADQTNAFISVDAAAATAQATAADAKRATGDHAALTGIPLAHKDIFLTLGQPTTAGSRMLENFVAPYDATVVERLAAAGMVCVGKTNMDEFAMGSSNENSYFGAVANPWSHSRVPGGSSGGSGAAVGGRLVPAATGTDTGGSIRQPAAFCGITGLKPTYGRISRYGMIAFASSLDQAGSMTHTAQDAAMMLSVMAGFDPRDSTSVDRNESWLADFENGALGTPGPMKIGLPQEYLVDHTGTELDTVRSVLESQGHTCVDISLPHTAAAVPTYYVIAGAEASTNLSRYDGVRFGHRCENPESLEDLYQRSRSEGFGSEVKRRIFTGTYALSVGYYDAYYLKAQKIRRLIANDFNAAFDSVDVILAPTTPGPAFERDSLTDDPVAMYNQDKYTVPVSLAGLPAMSIPAGFADNMPVGVQLIGPAFGENKLLELAHQFQQATDFHLAHPADTQGAKS